MIWQTKPDLVHFHNTFAMISPAAYHACHEAGVPVVQSLHNQRFMCPSANFLEREGRVRTVLARVCLGRVSYTLAIVDPTHKRL